MRKRKTNEETDTEWNKRPRATTTVDSGTPSIIIGSTSDTTNRKGTLKLYILHTTHPYRNLLISIIPADTQRRAREMRRAILLSKKPIRKIPSNIEFLSTNSPFDIYFIRQPSRLPNHDEHLYYRIQSTF